MNEHWPFWFRPLWALLLFPLGWLLWRLWHRQRRAGRWQSILPSAFHAVLLSGGAGRSSKLPWLALGLAWLLGVGALVGPSWQRVEQSTQKPADPLVVLFELTPEMLAADVSPNRLEAARRKLLDLLQSRGQAQTAIVVYAGSAHVLVPLSDDLTTSRNLLDALIPSIMPEPGQRADLAVDKALALLKQAGLGRGRILLIGSSLTDQERDGLHRRLGRQSPPLMMLGIGTADGAPVTEENGELLKDALGGIALPRLDSASLSGFIESLGGQYRQARVDSLDLRELGLLDAPHTMQNLESTQQLDTWEDQGYWLLLPLLLLSACAGRRGWLFCLPLLFCLPQHSYAFELGDLWLRPDQRGMQLLQAQQPLEAARQFEAWRWQGLALYEAGDYAGAAKRFAMGDTASDHYNRGNALARGGAYAAALDAYDQALERQPDLQPALKNRQLIQRLLKAQLAAQAARQQAEAQEQARQQALENTPPPPGRTGTSGTPSGATATQGEQPPTGATATPGTALTTSNQAGADDPNSTPLPNAPASHPTPPPANPVHGPGNHGSAPAPDLAGLDDDSVPKAPAAPADQELNNEQRQALEQWLRQIPDHPSELLRRKFWYEQQQRQDKPQ